MDLTPQLVNDVDFRTRRGGGYDADEVDDFLERVAVGVGELHDRIRQAQERAAAAESRARDAEAKLAAAPPPDQRTESDLDETLRRTLVLAQRTADAAVREAEESAARSLAEAEEKATLLVTEAEATAHRITTEAQDEARRGADETRQRLADEIVALEATRDLVQSDVALLERHVDEQRSRLGRVAADVQRVVDDPAALRLEPLPELSGATALPEAAASDDAEPESEPDVDFDAVAARISPPVELAAVGAASGPSPASLAVDGPPTVAVSLDAVVADEDVWRVDAPPVVDIRDSVTPVAVPAGGGGVQQANEDLRDEGPLGLFDGVSSDPGEVMAAERASIWDTAPADDPIDVDDDAYLSELRKAMIDEHNATSAASDDRPHKSRFGRRR